MPRRDPIVRNVPEWLCPACHKPIDHVIVQSVVSETSWPEAVPRGKKYAEYSVGDYQDTETMDPPMPIICPECESDITIVFRTDKDLHAEHYAVLVKIGERLNEAYKFVLTNQGMKNITSQCMPAIWYGEGLYFQFEARWPMLSGEYWTISRSCKYELQRSEKKGLSWKKRK